MNCGNNEQCSKLKVQKKNDPTNFFYSELEMLNNDILNLNKIKISQLYFLWPVSTSKQNVWDKFENF